MCMNALRLTDLKRKAIITAAAAEFRANGFEATSMDRIAAVAEVSKRTVYNHFPSKEELFAETIVQLFEASAAQQDLAYRGDIDVRVQLTELLRLKMRTLEDRDFLDLARVAIS